MDRLTFLDLFAGIGGFRRGMELAGHKCLGFCEWDKYARASYISMHCITDEQRKKLSTLDFKKRQKEIHKDEYLNGEWCSTDIRTVDANNIPRADCWCFGAPCQSFSIAGKRAGLDGESGLIREVFRILGEIEEEDRPEWLIYENVKGMFSSNRGFDYLAILLAMDELGYDVEWQIFNSKDWGVPQNRERVYTLGHLRNKGPRKIFPLGTADGENSVQVSLIGNRKGYHRNLQTFSEDGVTEALSTCGGGGREHHVAVPMFGIDYNVGGEERPLANTIKARYDAGVTNFKQDGTAVCIPITAGYKDGINETDVSPTLMARDYKGMNNQSMAAAGVCIPVLTPDRAEKRQNGRRFKDDGEPAFTLTSMDRHGVGVELKPESLLSESDSNNIDYIYCQRKVRVRKYNVDCDKLKALLKQSRKASGLSISAISQELNVTQTTVEHWFRSDDCFAIPSEDIWFDLKKLLNIQTDEFDKCIIEFEELDGVYEKGNRLYSEQGVSPTLMGANSECLCVKVNDTDGVHEFHPGMMVELYPDCHVYAVWYEKYQCYIAIRKLTPKECFRLQGWTDDYFERAEFVNSNSQLYKEAGNGVTVSVVYSIAKELKQYD